MRWHVLRNVLATAMMAAPLALAQQQQGRVGGMRGGGMRGGMRGGMGMGMGGGLMSQMREADENGNLLLEGTELDAVLAKLKDDSASVYVLLLKGVDVDGSGALSEEESVGVEEMLRVVQSIRPYDANKNWKFDDDEVVTAKEQMSSFLERYNENMIRRFDEDKNGKLSDKEVAAAKKQMEERRAQWQQRLQGGGNGEGDGQSQRGTGGRRGGGGR